MKNLLKNLGVILVVLGAIILIACYFTGDVNNNVILGSAMTLIVVGHSSFLINVLQIDIYPCCFRSRKPEILKVLPAFCLYEVAKWNYSFSGAMSLYPFPWIFIISMLSSSLRCLRSLVIYTSILRALK